MKTMEVPATSRLLRKILAEVQDDALLLTQDGKPVALLLPAEGLDAESLSLGTNRKFLAILRRSFHELDTGQRISLAEMRKRLKVPARRKRQ